MGVMLDFNNAILEFFLPFVILLCSIMLTWESEVIMPKICQHNVPRPSVCVSVCVFELKQRVGRGAAQLSPDGWRLWHHAPSYKSSPIVSPSVTALIQVHYCTL